jgi:hypothetical protein
VVFSYGEIDCRRHAAQLSPVSPDKQTPDSRSAALTHTTPTAPPTGFLCFAQVPLARAYITQIRRYVAEACVISGVGCADTHSPCLPRSRYHQHTGCVCMYGETRHPAPSQPLAIFLSAYPVSAPCVCAGTHAWSCAWYSQRGGAGRRRRGGGSRRAAHRSAGAAGGEPIGCLNDAPCPPLTSHGAPIRQPLGACHLGPFQPPASDQRDNPGAPFVGACMPSADGF